MRGIMLENECNDMQGMNRSVVSAGGGKHGRDEGGAPIKDRHGTKKININVLRENRL